MIDETADALVHELSCKSGFFPFHESTSDIEDSLLGPFEDDEDEDEALKAYSGNISELVNMLDETFPKTQMVQEKTQHREKICSDILVSENGLRLFTKEVDGSMDIVAYRSDGCYLFYRHTPQKAPQRVAAAPYSVPVSNFTSMHAFLYAYEATLTCLLMNYSSQIAFTPNAPSEDACIVGTVYGIIDYCITQLELNGFYEYKRLTILGTSPDHDIATSTAVYSVCQAMLEKTNNRGHPLKKTFLKRIDAQIGDRPLCKRMQSLCDELLYNI